MKEYCRLCAELKNPDEIVASISNVEQSMEEKLRACCCWTIQNIEQHRLPHSVCAICLDRLDKCWLFAQSVQLAQQRLLEIFDDKTDTNLLAAELVQAVYNIQSSKCNQQSSDDQRKQKPNHKCESCSQKFCTVAELNVHRQQGCEGLIEIDSIAVDCKPTAVDFNTDLHSNDTDATGNAINVDRQSKLSKSATINDVKKNIEKNSKSTKSPSKELQLQLKQQPKCNECGETFSTKSNLARHHRRKHTTTDQANKRTTKLACSCEICGKLCENDVGLKIHRRTHLDEHPFQCRECGRLFTLKSDLIDHCQRAHSDQRPFQCNECGQGFKEKWALTRHHTRHTDEQPFECWLCHRMFKDRSLLYLHLKTHTIPAEKRYKAARMRWAKRRRQPNGIEYKCNECEKTFSNKPDLRKHNRMHDAEGSFKCNECGRYFRSKAIRRQHFSMHTGERPYECSLCDKSFRLRNSLKSHLLGHTQGPTAEIKIDDTGTEAQLIQTSGGASIDLRRLIHKCDDCGRIFPRLSELKEHRAKHSNERPFECWLCHKTYPTRRIVKYHLRIHVRPQPTKRDYICELCGKTYRHSFHLNEHLHSAHSDQRPHKCDTCGLGFKTERLLKAHHLSHTENQFKCTQCEKSFRHKHSLVQHMEYHTGLIAKPFVCDVCEKGFRVNANLVDHRRIHTGEKPFACEHCASNFRTMSSCYSHLKKIHGISVSARNREAQIRATEMSSRNHHIMAGQEQQKHQTKLTIK